ncbi:hypothetical protein K8I31_04195, partial [bacterium]|nr:hypothetical protein [bacterium]
HTPNHRWVVSAALAQIHDIYPNGDYIQRINQWLAEGMDIDEEGQFTERSTTVYNAVCDYSFVVLAHKLKRPELLEPVRQNLNAMLYLLHPNFEVVTEISRRQDINTRGTMGRYWLALRYMAILDQNGQYASILQSIEPGEIKLSSLMEYPILSKPMPALKAIPDDYVKSYPSSEITRIRHGKTSATILHKENSRWFSFRNGEAVVNAVRFASAFFGKGQFVPDEFVYRNGVYCFKQHLRGAYYQPIEDETYLPVSRDNWGSRRSTRKQSEIAEMIYEATIKDVASGFELTISAKGTDRVPVSVEINLRDNGVLNGIVDAPSGDGSFLLKEGFAQYKVGDDLI